jgi:DNA-binding response OmpR family regulator
MKFLIVEDSDSIRSCIVEFLKYDFGDSEIRTAINGKEGLDQLQTFSPDVIILDYLMPIMDGLEFSKGFRKLYPSSTAKIILQSGSVSEREIAELKPLVDVFFPKPFDIEEMADWIKNLTTAQVQVPA